MHRIHGRCDECCVRKLRRAEVTLLTSGIVRPESRLMTRRAGYCDRDDRTDIGANDAARTSVCPSVRLCGVLFIVAIITHHQV